MSQMILPLKPLTSLLCLNQSVLSLVQVCNSQAPILENTSGGGKPKNGPTPIDNIFSYKICGPTLARSPTSAYRCITLILSSIPKLSRSSDSYKRVKSQIGISPIAARFQKDCISVLPAARSNPGYIVDAGYKNIPDIRTIFWKTILISTVYFIPVIRTYFPTPKGVLITGIHCNINLS